MDGQMSPSASPEVRGGQAGMKSTASLGKELDKGTREKPERRQRVGQGEDEVEGDGWKCRGSTEKVERNERKGEKREACQPLFSERVCPPSRTPVRRSTNHLIAVCWVHTNQAIDMCTLSFFPFPYDCQTSQWPIWLH